MHLSLLTHSWCGHLNELYFISTPIIIICNFIFMIICKCVVGLYSCMGSIFIIALIMCCVMCASISAFIHVCVLCLVREQVHATIEKCKYICMYILC